MPNTQQEQMQQQQQQQQPIHVEQEANLLQQQQQLAPDLQMQLQQQLGGVQEQGQQQAQPIAADPQQVQTNPGRKSWMRPLTAEQQAERERERRRHRAEMADQRTVFVDKVRHGFYGVVKNVVTLWKSITTKSDTPQQQEPQQQQQQPRRVVQRRVKRRKADTPPQRRVVQQRVKRRKSDAPPERRVVQRRVKRQKPDAPPKRRVVQRRVKKRKTPALPRLQRVVLQQMQPNNPPDTPAPIQQQQQQQQRQTAPPDNPAPVEEQKEKEKAPEPPDNPAPVEEQKEKEKAPESPDTPAPVEEQKEKEKQPEPPDTPASVEEQKEKEKAPEPPDSPAPVQEQQQQGGQPGTPAPPQQQQRRARQRRVHRNNPANTPPNTPPNPPNAPAPPQQQQQRRRQQRRAPQRPPNAPPPQEQLPDAYHESLQIAYDEIYARRLAVEDDPEKLAEFELKHGGQFQIIQAEYNRVRDVVKQQMEREKRRQEGKPADAEVQLDQQELERRQIEALQRRDVTVRFGQQNRANVVGGTKPAAVQYGNDGSKWLVKESVSCIGLDAPDAAIVTEAGYKIQKLVNPDTAIEAFRGRSVGKGVVSYQRMVQGVKTDDVDLFKFSRTPEALTDAQLKRVQELAPQILREHTTDWLLCNFDTKGENFLIVNDGIGQDRVYGIDKEAAFRPILDQGAQHMSKDYCRFDQNTVYNRLFQQFASGKMNMNLHQVLPQIQRVESMSDADYMGIFADFIHQKEREYGADSPVFDQICKNVLARKTNLRMEYRDFFTKLVEERCANVPPDEAEALRIQYFGAPDGGMFLFAGETAEQIRAEHARRVEMRSENQEEREARAKRADAADEASYKRRHFLYDTSKTLVMGAKRVFSVFQKEKPEQRVTNIPLSQVKTEHQEDPAFQERYQQELARIQRQANGNEEELQRLMNTTMIPLQMVRFESVHLGGTKPMSQYIGADGSKWLTKQAVNCLGFYKPEGALLTEAGARLQKIVDEKTAVDAFVGRTKEHGEVSFQRRLDNVESGPGKLDLFRFSKHPELATPETIQAVQDLAPQILREHTTDWLLCNFDTKGENFIITMDQDQRVLHGIDKEAAFNKILDPQAQHMSTSYRPHANDTLYNVIFRMYANNDMDFDLFSVLPQIEKIEAIPTPEDYLNTFDAYLQHMQQTKPKDFDQIRENILERRRNLRQEYCNFFTNLVLERCKKLHPDDAAALKERYFGSGGSQFRFPASPPAAPAAPAAG